MAVKIRPLFFALPVALVLAVSGCGDDPAPSSTTISGQVVKGPVGGASVCVYAITGGVRATSTLVPCVTSDATGNYSFTSFSYTGDVVVEATGGTYKNEATGATTTLGSPLRTLLPAQGGAVSGVVTPLTTVAFSSSANLTSASFAQAAGNVAAQAGLSGTNILTAAPTFAGANGITATNAYAAVLGAFAQYQQTGGFTTAQALSAWTPANQAAFQAAMSTYAANAGVIAANLPSALNFAATGGALGFSASSATATGSVVGAGGLVASSALSLTGAGAGFQPLVGQALTVTSTLQTIAFTGVSATLGATRDSTGTTVTYVEFATQKAWSVSCKGAGCITQIVIDTANKKVTFNNVTLTGESPATGIIVVNGSATYN